MNAYIKSLLDKNNIPQKQLAQILGISGSAIAQWTSMLTISPDNLYSLSKLFNISIDDLLNERFAKETTEEKCERLYNIDGLDFDELTDGKNIIRLNKWRLSHGAISEGKHNKNIKEDVLSAKQKLYDLSIKLYNMSNNIYELLYKKFQGNINDDELKELDYIRKYYGIKFYVINYFKNYYKELVNELVSEVGHNVSFHNKDRDMVIGDILKNKIDINDKDSFMWELQKIFVCNKKIAWEKLREKAGEIDDEVFCYIYGSYTQLEKDMIVTQAYNKLDMGMDGLNYLISLGSNILYSKSFFPDIIFDKDDLKDLEGSIVNLSELDKKKEILDKIYYDHYELLNYNEYKSMINTNEMMRIKNYKYREKDPIKYWEYFKKEIY